MKKKFVLGKNSFTKHLGLSNDQLKNISGGLRPGPGPYLPTRHDTGSGSDEVEHALSCPKGTYWNDILKTCVKY